MRRTSLNQRKIRPFFSAHFLCRMHSIVLMVSAKRKSVDLSALLCLLAQTTSLSAAIPRAQGPTNHPVWQSFRNSEASFECSLGMCLTTYPSDLSPGVLDSGRKLGKNYSRKLLNHQGSKPLKQTKFWATMATMATFGVSLQKFGHLLSISQVLPVPRCHRAIPTSGIRHHLAHSEEGRSSRSPTKATGQNRQSWCGTADCTEKTS